MQRISIITDLFFSKIVLYLVTLSKHNKIWAEVLQPGVLFLQTIIKKYLILKLKSHFKKIYSWSTDISKTIHLAAIIYSALRFIHVFGLGLGKHILGHTMHFSWRLKWGTVSRNKGKFKVLDLLQTTPV